MIHYILRPSVVFFIYFLNGPFKCFKFKGKVNDNKIVMNYFSSFIFCLLYPDPHQIILDLLHCFEKISVLLLRQFKFPESLNQCMLIGFMQNS